MKYEQKIKLKNLIFFKDVLFDMKHKKPHMITRWRRNKEYD